MISKKGKSGRPDLPFQATLHPSREGAATHFSPYDRRLHTCCLVLWLGDTRL